MESVVDANELCDRVGGIVKATDLTYGASGRLRGKRCSDLGVRDEQAGKQTKKVRKQRMRHIGCSCHL